VVGGGGDDQRAPGAAAVFQHAVHVPAAGGGGAAAAGPVGAAAAPGGAGAALPLPPPALPVAAAGQPPPVAVQPGQPGLLPPAPAGQALEVPEGSEANDFGWPATAPWIAPHFRRILPLAAGALGYHSSHVMARYRSVDICTVCGGFSERVCSGKLCAPCSGIRSDHYGRRNLLHMRVGHHPKTNRDFAGC
jgi:hypothetical protein